MKQPELGKLVALARNKRSLTQEELAESCDVSVRTIQRIENGSVTPQAFTVKALVEKLEIGLDQNGRVDRTGWIILIHLSTLLLLFPVPLVMLAFKGKENVLLETHAKKALNFQITMLLVLFSWFGLTFLGGLSLGAIAGVTLRFLLGFAFIPPIGLFIWVTILSIVNCFRTLSQREIRYPLAIQFLR